MLPHSSRKQPLRFVSRTALLYFSTLHAVRCQLLLASLRWEFLSYSLDHSLPLSRPFWIVRRVHREWVDPSRST